MSNSVLYVDDEEKSLKYFKKLFDKDYEILTATSADLAWKILEERKGKITVLLSDQKMPGKTGVELLTQVRQKYPKIMRMIITAYADLDSAIKSVNEGAIYQYITKPWESRQLYLTLKQAIDFSNLQEERDLLLQTKLTMIQRLIIYNRVQNLSAFLVGQSHLQNALQGLTAFITQLPGDVQLCGKSDRDDPHVWQRQNKAVLNLLQTIKEKTVNIAKSVGSKVDVKTFVQSIVDKVNGKSGKIDVVTEIEDCTIEGGVAETQGCFEMLIQGLFTLCEGNSKGSIRVTAPQGLPKEIHIDISLDRDWEDRLPLCYSMLWQDDEIDLSRELFIVFLTIFHHGGTIAFKKDRAGFEVKLPVNENPRIEFLPEVKCMDVLTQRFSYWDAM